MDCRVTSLSLIAFIGFFVTPVPAATQTPDKPPLLWNAWTDDLFERASQEGRFVLLDLEAVWCHWCHVMERTTYHDPRVVELLKSRYITVRVDQDANPDLSHRYEDYGWPATVVFAPDGIEIVKRRGYIPPENMASMLQAIIDDPSPGPSVVPERAINPAAQAGLTAAQRKWLIDHYLAVYDTEYSGWGTIHKFIHVDSLDYALLNAHRGDQPQAMMARTTLNAAVALIDPEWGGVYQYSDQRNWRSPHYEKLLSVQANYLRHYALAHALWNDPAYLKAARAIERYLKEFLTSPDGAFYVSQDADLNQAHSGRAFYALKDSERRKLGMPRLDKNLYARENGWTIIALTALYNATGDGDVLDRAQHAAHWVIAHRSLPGGGFRHGEKDRIGPLLGDSLAMAQAFLALYTSTAERGWLERAAQAMAFVERNFMDKREGGFVTAPLPPKAPGVFRKPVKQLDEQITLARVANLLFHYTGEARYQALAQHAMRYLAAPAIIDSNRFLAGVLLAEHELTHDPVHITVVGEKHDPMAKGLFAAALRYPAPYKRTEWWDRREGGMPNPDVQYPQLPKAAAFVCINKTCSVPVFKPGELTALADRLHRAPAGQ